MSRWWRPDRGLVEDVDDALQPGADLRRQPHAVGLAGGQGGRGAVEGQVPDAHPLQEGEPLQHRGQDAVRHRPLALGEGDRLQRRHRLRDGQPRVVGDGAAAEAHGQALRPQARAVAVPALRFRQVRAQALEGVAVAAFRLRQRERLLRAAHQVGQDPREVLVPVQERALAAAGQRRHGLVEGEAVTRGQVLERLAHRARAVGLPRMDRPVAERALRIGDDLVRVHLPAPAQTLAGRAGAVGAVEGERPRRHLGHGEVAARAGERPAVEPLLGADGHEHDAAGEVGGPLDARHQPPPGRGTGGQAVHEDLDAMVPARVQGDAVLEVERAAVHARAAEPGRGQRVQLLAEPTLAPAGHRGQHGDRGLAGRWRGSRPRCRPGCGRRRGRRSAGSGAGRRPRTARGGGRRSRSPSPRWTAGGWPSSAARWRWPGTARRPSPRPACRAGRGTAGRRRRGSPRTGAGPRRTGCRRPGCSSRTRTDR